MIRPELCRRMWSALVKYQPGPGVMSRDGPKVSHSSWDTRSRTRNRCAAASRSV